MPASMKMDKPEYHNIDADKMSVHKDSDKQIKVIAGKFQKAEGPIKKCSCLLYTSPSPRDDR